ncbi:MerR family transcriptional regulator [Mycobacterium sp. LTG2003]
MNEELLSIGEFAAECGLSAKMLRSYAAMGVLIPAAVDELTGYRYYNRHQVAEARTVALLRQAHVPVAEIAAYLREPSERQLAAWLAALDAEYDTRRQALGTVGAELATRPNPVVGRRRSQPEDERTFLMASVLAAATASDQGPVRESNQDAVLADGILYAVADGFGVCGEHASRIALEVLAAGFAAAPDRAGLIQAVKHANQQVWEFVTGDGAVSGATLTAVAVFGSEDGGPLAVNIGDSPLHLIRDGRMDQLTDDHSVAGELVRAGEITRDEARSHPQRHLLTRALGIGPHIQPDLLDIDCRPGDRLLISTDGLFAAAADAAIADAAATVAPEAAVRRLVDVANDAGGHDNTSVVIIDIG